MPRRRTVPRRRLDEPGVGDTGPRVAGLQHALNQLTGGDLLKVDGQFGPVTAAALAAAQAELGVTGEDGYLGRATRAALRARRDGTGARRSRSVTTSGED